MLIEVTASVHREDRFYVIDVRGYGVTQALSPSSVVPMAQDYVACLAGVDPGEVVVDVRER